MRKTLTTFLQKTGNAISFTKLLQWSGQSLILPFYHSLQGADALPHLQHLYPLRSVEQFKEDLDFFCKYFEPVGLLDLMAYVKNGKLLPEKAFLLSFDDGLKEVYTIVRPILKSRGIPATIFLNSAFVDNKDLFFRYKAGVLIDHFLKNPPTKIQLEALLLILQEYGFPKTDFKSTLLKINYQNQRVLDEVAAILKIDFNDFLNQYQPYLTSHQIQELIQDGFTFGGHSVDHPQFKTLNLTEQIRQSRESISFVQNQFNVDYRTFAFPFTDHGVRQPFFEKIKHEKIAELTFGCAGQKQQTYPFHFQRIPMEESQTSAEVQLKAELIYFLLKIPFGKNIVKYQFQ